MHTAFVLRVAHRSTATLPKRLTLDPAKVPDDARKIAIQIMAKEGRGARSYHRMLVILEDAGTLTVDSQGESLLTPVPDGTGFA